MALALVTIVLGIFTAGVATFFILLAAAADAYLIAKKLQEGTPVGRFENFLGS